MISHNLEERMRDLNPDMSLEEKLEAIYRISIKDKDHLKRFLRGGQRDFLVFNTADLVDSLRWPEGIDALMSLVSCYRNHRATLQTGRSETQVDPTLGKQIQVPITKGEPLEIEELDRAIRLLIRQASERDPKWNLENQPL